MTASKNEKGISEEAVSEIYRRFLAGEPLESIKTTNEIKTAIRAFSKYSTLSAYQISEKTGISTRICATLRKMNRVHRRMYEQHVGISYAVRGLLNGQTAEYLKLHNVTPETIKKAKKCLKIMELGGNASDLYKIGLSHSNALKLIELYESNKIKLLM